MKGDFMPEKRERKPPVTLYDVNARVHKLEDFQRLTLSDLLFQPSINDLAYFKQTVDQVMTKPKPVVRWPRLLVAFVLGCYCMALGLTVWYPAPPPSSRAQSNFGQTSVAIAPGYAFTYQPAPEPERPLHLLTHLSISNTSHNPCWVGITGPNDVIIRQGFLAPEATVGTDATVEKVRDSCPGELIFELDGQLIHPTPEAGHRHDVEVVTIS